MIEIGYISDLHLDYRVSKEPISIDTSGLDLLIVAGDIWNGNSNCEEFGTGCIDKISELTSDTKVPTLFVPGDHEFYGQSIKDGVSKIKKRAQKTNIRVLYRDSFNFEGIEFLGATLWPTFMLYGEDKREESIRLTQEQIMPNKPIHNKDIKNLMSARALMQEGEKDLAWLKKRISNTDGPKILISHMSGSSMSMSPYFMNDPLSPYFINPYDDLVRHFIAHIHGHTHHNVSKKLASGTGLFSNPKGYESEFKKSEIDPEMLQIYEESIPELKHKDEVIVNENLEFNGVKRFKVSFDESGIARLKQP